MDKTTRILGFDPGTHVSGFGIVEIVNKKPVIVDMGTIRFKRGADLYERLKDLHNETHKIIDKYRPDVLAIEAPFYGKNVQVMLKLGRAQGAIILAASLKNLPIYEYSPSVVKQSITGMGLAAKQQVAYFLKKVYGLTQLEEAGYDATDAVAVAICHFIELKKPHKSKDYKNWEDFIKKNPDKIV